VTSTTPTLSEDLLLLTARRMRIIAEPTRIRILLLLERQPATVQGLCDELLVAHQNVSKHVNVLHGAGILSRTREGSCVRYAIADYTILRILAQATASTTGYLQELADLANPGE
jgi:DNA-binding transcriptional ArsR family regulator